jgi:hypothetical protein
MKEYKWLINSLDCIAKKEEMINVVTLVHWSRLVEQYVGAELVEVSISSTMTCASPSETDFTAYPDLTFEQICKWLEKGLNVYEIDANLDYQINKVINPPIITLPLPWAKNKIIEEKEVILEPKTI